VRLQPAQSRLLPKEPIFRVFLVGANNSKHGSSPLKPTNGSIVDTGIYLRDV